MKTITAYRPHYMPFIMGGSVHRFLKAELPVKRVIRFAHGIKVAECVSPKGKVAVIEVTSGGMVGDSIGGVKADFKTAPANMTRKSIADAKHEISSSMGVDTVDAATWWTGKRDPKSTAALI